MTPTRLAFALFALPALAFAAPGEERAPRAFSHDMKPGEVVEECLRLEAGKSRAFEWASDGPVNFNIHYHSGDKVAYPVRLDGQKNGQGKFTAGTGEDYCWMWTAKFPTRLTGKLQAEE